MARKEKMEQFLKIEGIHGDESGIGDKQQEWR
jgi:hypothetical protein